MSIDFKRFLVEQPDVTRAEVTDAMWADLGRRMHDNIMDDRFVMAVVSAFLAASNPPPGIAPNRFAANKIRAFIFSGTVAR